MANATQLPQPQVSRFRRVVTTRTKNGSQVQIDAPARNFGALHEFWMTDAGGDPLAERTPNDDAADRPFQISPSHGGSVFRFVEMEPESNFAHMDAEERRAAVRRAFSAVGSENVLVDTRRHPAMHQTETIDYIIVLEGELTMLLDNGEVQLKPFDVVVQRGTNHAWINTGSKTALVAAILKSPA